MERYRDLTLVPLSGDKWMVFACDTTAGIGAKPYDSLSVDPEWVGRMCMRVPLMELLCLGVEPTISFHLFSTEMTPTGQALLAGIQAELALANCHQVLQNGSTEENMVTQSTALGLVVAGQAATDQLLWKQARPGDRVYLLGHPYVGSDVLTHYNALIDYSLVRHLRPLPFVHELVPIGSKGAMDEARQTAAVNHLTFLADSREQTASAPVYQSAGPATAILVVGSAEAGVMLSSLDIPLWDLGRLATSDQ